ncbi:protein of unknown function (plasmid) [Agrobacterium pusense]|uniref:Uncharacterized protein n=1 Tax=Agrobacterium pusense TaxID=648995 RepID=U4QEJ7_9HYPH|nr:protein of unknown function [Agrobacterium pusense]
MERHRRFSNLSPGPVHESVVEDSDYIERQSTFGPTNDAVSPTAQVGSGGSRRCVLSGSKSKSQSTQSHTVGSC